MLQLVDCMGGRCHGRMTQLGKAILVFLASWRALIWVLNNHEMSAVACGIW